MININKISWLIVFISTFSFIACSSDDEGMNTSQYYTDIKEISIVNAGAQGNEVVSGVIDEDLKTISFPRIDANTDLSAIRFETVLSDGARLDKESYKYSIPEGDSEDTQVLKVINHTRYREYFAKIRLLVPVFGGDFDKAIAYHNSAVGGNTYSHFGVGVTRGTDFNGEYALIVSRKDGLAPHLLSREDIIAGKLDQPIMLNTEGIVGGTFPISGGRLVQDKIYIANMASSLVKVYMWDTPTSKPQLIFEQDLLEAGEGGRFGDSMDMYLDESGNGFIFFENNSSSKIRRIQISNFTTVDKVDVINPKASTGSAGGQYFSYTKVEGTPYYLYTGFSAPLMLVDEGGNMVTKITSTPERINQARIVNFNEKRYLVGVTAARYPGDSGQSIYVYDITRGNNVVDALNLLEVENYKPVFNKAFGVDVTTSPGTNCGAAVVDDKLYIFGAADGQGFVMYEVPEASLED
ncbi:DUF4623 domain-containing protein [Bacteroides propionicifaciens]|uniref:DUF4623 domain-containing protein n=1 Tax=Bacteroides propionicifaciens TaxID=392838 RepID=UPI00039F3CC4|nr:DUF4623 domain-containing protein [Bacteroides propionicifaciens]